MKLTEMCRKYHNFGRPQQRTLIYSVTEDPACGLYGVSIRVAETGETRTAPDIALSRAAAERLLDRHATCGATPQTMPQLLSGVLCA